MKFTIIIVFLLLGSCGSNDPPDMYPWTLEEKGPPPAEVWYQSSPLDLEQYHPDNLPATEIKPFNFKIYHDAGDSWVSVGGPFAIPTRHWIKCPGKYSISEGFHLLCLSGKLQVFARDTSTLSHLPQWLEDQIDWEKGFDRSNWNPEDGVTIALPSFYVRVYEPDKSKLWEGRWQVIIGAIDLVANDMDRLEGPVWMRPKHGRLLEKVDLSERCGSNTNCASGF